MLRAIALTAALFSLAFASAARAGHPLETSILAPEFAYAPAAGLFFDRAAASGATNVVIDLDWGAIAPATPPADFVAMNPADPSYRWEMFDRQVDQAASRGLSVFARLLTAPAWALDPAAPGAPSTVPDVDALRDFATAAARRFSGTFEGHPRVRYWGVWNEPNLSISFEPQFLNGEPLSPTWYRAAVNAVADGVKSVAADNLVVAGGTAPFYDLTPAVTAVDPNWGPLSFMRKLLCLGVDLTPACAETVRFDIWAHHPYTSGGPTRSAVKRDDVSLGDLPEMRAVLRAGQEAGTVVSPAEVGFWVTEFSWDSNPPDPNGVPEPLLTRWVAEGLYRMWSDGITLVTWFTIRDYPLFEWSPYQAGLYFRGETEAGDTPKPLLRAFEFPFVAFARRNQVSVWGRTPRGRQARVVVEQSFPGGWNTLGVMVTNAHGIFEARFLSAPLGLVRARTDLGEEAVPFSLDRVADRRYDPFGAGPLEPIVDPVRPQLPQIGTYDSSRRAEFQRGLR